MRHAFLQFFLFVFLISGLATNIAGELDLREANVINVTFSNFNDDMYTFSVTLYHDDDGETGYADSWHVETLDGKILGTRILTHAHGTVEFTRSGEIIIPKTVNTVIVRGHDQTHDFGGQVMILSLSNASTIFINQGPEPLNFTTFSFQEYLTNVSSTNVVSADENFTTSIITVDELPSPTTLIGEPESETNNLDFNFISSGLILFFWITLTKLIPELKKYSLQN